MKIIMTIGLGLLMVGCNRSNHEPVQLDAAYSTNALVVYEDTFGEPPERSVRSIVAERRSFVTTEVNSYLRFSCSSDQFIHLRGTNFALISECQFDPNLSSMFWAVDPPTWWNPVHKYGSTWHAWFSEGVAIMSYELTSSVAHVWWKGPKRERAEQSGAPLPRAPQAGRSEGGR